MGIPIHILFSSTHELFHGKDYFLLFIYLTKFENNLQYILFVTKHIFNPYFSETKRQGVKMHHLVLEKLEN